MVRNTAGVRHYFMEAFTPYGYISILPEMLRETKHTYILTGGPGTGKSTMIKLIGIQLVDRGVDVDYIRSLREPDSVAGLYLPKQNLGLFDENEFVPDTLARKEYYRQIEFDGFCNHSKLTEQGDRIRELKEILSIIENRIIERLKVDYSFQQVDEPSFLSVESLLGNDWETVTSRGINEVAEILSKVRRSSYSFCFLHALQVDGWLNLAPGYLKDYDRICLDGEDSPNILKDILQEVRSLGQVMEVIINPIRFGSVLGIVFPYKKLAVWKGDPSRIEEQGFAKKHSSDLHDILEEHRTYRIELKSRINETVNFHRLDDLRNDLLSSILYDLKE